MAASYVWLLVPSAAAPLIVINARRFPVGQFQSNGGPVLEYGWLLPVVYALLPYGFTRLFRPEQPARLGGSWLSLAAAYLGGLFFWPGLFLPAAQAWLHGIAFALWAVALLPVVRVLWQTTAAAVSRTAPMDVASAGLAAAHQPKPEPAAVSTAPVLAGRARPPQR